MSKKIVTHLIIGLGKGGAETMLYQVLKYRTDMSIVHRVISLGMGDYYKKKIENLGVEVVELYIKKYPLSILLRLKKEISKSYILCSWMYHANFLGYLLKCKNTKLVWCIRHSNLDPKMNKSATLRINNICAKWSKNVAKIAYNGNKARKVHEEIGYFKEKGMVIDNGCDGDVYKPIINSRNYIDKELGIDNNKKIIFSATKNHPIKDVPNFLKAFADIHKNNVNVIAVMCGNGITEKNEQIIAFCRENHLEINRDIFLLGMRHDLPVLFSACDIYVLHSAGEAFPNTLLQAMSCGCACISTDVGNARQILNHDDCIVPAQDSKALINKMNELLTMSKDELIKMGNSNRTYVTENFDIRDIVKKYEELF